MEMLQMFKFDALAVCATQTSTLIHLVILVGCWGLLLHGRYIYIYIEEATMGPFFMPHLYTASAEIRLLYSGMDP